MKDFNAIIENIEKELLELKKINQFLMEENTTLRMQLAMPIQKDNDELSIEEMLEQFYVKDDSHGIQARLKLLLKRGGFKVVGDFRGKNIYELLKIRGTGPVMHAIIIIVLEHYGIDIEIPNLEKETTRKPREIQQIIEEVTKYKERIVFIND